MRFQLKKGSVIEQAARMKVLLQRIEWNGDEKPRRRCPACRNIERFGHADDCELADLLDQENR